MKKFCFVIAFAFFAVKGYGVHDLFINGSSATTVTTADTLNITCSLETATAIAIMYYDINGNGQLDPGDPWLYKSKLIDGGFDDEDETVNGNYQELREPFTFAGKFLYWAEDGGVDDTVALTVTPLPSSHSVSGTVTEPANTPHILVTLIDIIDPNKIEFEYGWGQFTNPSGEYNIPIPNSCAGTHWSVVALDIARVVPDYSSNDPLIDTITIVGNVTMNIAMDHIVPPCTTVIIGVLKDQLGNPITDSTLIIGGRGIPGATIYRSVKPVITDGSGAYRIRLRGATPGQTYGYLVNAGIATQFYGQYMNPATNQTTNQKQGIGPTCDSIFTINLKAYTVNCTISGWVTKDGSPYDKCELRADAANFGGNYTKTYSDGHYEMGASDAASIYLVKPAPRSLWSVPCVQGYNPLPPQSNAACGDTGINFNVIGVEESSKPEQKPLLLVYPNPFIGKVVFEVSLSGKTRNLVIHDITGRMITEVKPEIRDGVARFVLASGEKGLVTGIYFYSLTIGDKVFKGKVVKLH